MYLSFQNAADNDNLGLTTMEYSPQQGFPMSYYPYRNQKDYRSPLVFVKFNNVTSHLGLMIECKALAKNIEVDRSEKEGSVHFELLMDVWEQQNTKLSRCICLVYKFNFVHLSLVMPDVFIFSVTISVICLFKKNIHGSNCIMYMYRFTCLLSDTHKRKQCSVRTVSAP